MPGENRSVVVAHGSTIAGIAESTTVMDSAEATEYHQDKKRQEVIEKLKAVNEMIKGLEVLKLKHFPERGTS